MTYLTSNQLKQYNEDGYIAPINVLTKDEANEVREEIESSKLDFNQTAEKEQNIAVMFTDISNFTKLSEGLEPKQVLEKVVSDENIKKETPSDDKKTEVSKVKKQTSDKKLEAENKIKK